MTNKQLNPKSHMQQYAQGDLLIERIVELPLGLTPKQRDQGRLILAHGEVTGHCHAISDQQVEGWVDDAGVTYLDVQKAMAALKHDEHGTIRLRRGTYRIIRQREYTPNAIRQVTD